MCSWLVPIQHSRTVHSYATSLRLLFCKKKKKRVLPQLKWKRQTLFSFSDFLSCCLSLLLFTFCEKKKTNLKALIGYIRKVPYNAVRLPERVMLPCSAKCRLGSHLYFFGVLLLPNRWGARSLYRISWSPFTFSKESREVELPYLRVPPIWGWTLFALEAAYKTKKKRQVLTPSRGGVDKVGRGGLFPANRKGGWLRTSASSFCREYAKSLKRKWQGKHVRRFR